MKSPAEQLEINAARKRAAVQRQYDNLREALEVTTGRLKRAQAAKDAGDLRLGANVPGLQAEADRLTAVIANYAATHNLNTEAAQ